MVLHLHSTLSVTGRPCEVQPCGVSRSPAAGHISNGIGTANREKASAQLDINSKPRQRRELGTLDERAIRTSDNQTSFSLTKNGEQKTWR